MKIFSNHISETISLFIIIVPKNDESLRAGVVENENLGSMWQNKAKYTTTHVACWWAGIKKANHAFGLEQ